ncbi:MAG: serine/threonine protein kinase [Pirellulales bacterium]|nr:serine/threonine protein kinase [Pirellulales bacterium]
MARATPGYIGPYRLLNVVNTGQTSRIWQAFDDAAGEMAGIKVLLEEFQRNREHLAYLKQEWLVGGELKHKRIIRFRGFSIDRGIPYLAMEWWPAPNLKQRMRYAYDQIEHQIPKIIEQACEGLSYLHQHGWVHRDIKPDNLLVSEECDIKLIDFALAQRIKVGLAKILGGKSKIQGTRSYMSPEQIRGGVLDGRADLYSLGCTIFELLAQTPPFTGTSANDLLMKHLKASPPPVETANRNITPAMGELLRKAMAKDPANRPNSVEDFLTEFRMIQVFKKPPKPPEESS